MFEFLRKKSSPVAVDKTDDVFAGQQGARSLFYRLGYDDHGSLRSLKDTVDQVISYRQTIEAELDSAKTWGTFASDRVRSLENRLREAEILREILFALEHNVKRENEGA